MSGAGSIPITNTGREQLRLFRRMHFLYAEGSGEKATRCEFAVKIPRMADDTAERS